jgi:hypothetical protein
MKVNGLTSIVIGSIMALSSMSVATAATQEECEAGLQEVNTAIGSKEGVLESARTEAEQLSEEAQTANDRGDFDQCMELVTQAKDALDLN